MKILLFATVSIILDHIQAGCVEKPVKLNVGTKYQTTMGVTCTVNAKDTYLNYVIKDKSSMEKLLKIEKSTLPMIGPLFFKNFGVIQYLILDSIKMKNIYPGAFSELTKLAQISLRNNELTEIKVGVFNILGVLKILGLSNNQISTIHNDSFAGLTKLEKIYLDNNKIVAFGDTLFKSQVSLDTLSITKNLLTTINSVNTKNLLLDSNKITKINQPKNTIKLQASNNRLSIVTKTMFASTLEHIDLSANVIMKIDSDAFQGLKKLTKLMLDNNQLHTLPNACFKDLIALKYLSLSFNFLTTIPYGLLDPFQKLITLNIGYNMFGDLHQYTFHNLGSLEELNIGGNKISSFNYVDLRNHLGKLKKIYLDGNAFNCKDLVTIITYLQQTKVVIIPGANFTTYNIKGIACNKETTTTKSTTLPTTLLSNNTKIVYTPLNDTLIYNFFNSGFKNSSFYQYLEKFQFPNITILQNQSHPQEVNSPIDLKELSKIVQSNYTPKDHEYIFPSTIIFLLIVIIALLISSICTKKKHHISKEEIQLY